MLRDGASCEETQEQASKFVGTQSRLSPKLQHVKYAYTLSEDMSTNLEPCFALEAR
jgi:hypothetical protein